MFENKIIEDNKILISNLKARMFRGYHKVAKKSKSLIHNYKTKINFNPIYTPKRKEKQQLDPYIKTYTNHFPTKLNKEILPFENDYQDVYKNKYFSNSNKLQLNVLEITNLSKNKNKLNTKNKNIYLTESKNCPNFKNIINNMHNKEIDKNNQERALNVLFPYKEELNQFCDLPFFSLTKNPYNLRFDLANSKSGSERNIKNTLQEDFLYKISHKREFEPKFINNNFIKNKGIKKGNNTHFKDIYLNNKKKLKLQLDIQNMNENKPIYLNSKEKRYRILEKEMEPIKDIVSLFRDFENNFLVEESNNNEEKNDKNNENENINRDTNIKSEIKTNFVTERNFDGFEEARRTTYNFKKPKFYPINYYSSNQLKSKEKKYENSHKLGLKEHQRKINIKEDKKEKYNKKSYELDEYEKQYFNKLFNKKIMTNKMAFMRECRIRDIIITNKLKCEFSPSDIKRLLNGLKPWNDCEKLDKKFLLKKLPKSVDDFKLEIK